jgi:hypothetical protein
VSEREEVTLYDGREWRIHYWLFKKDKILELAQSNNERADMLNNQDDASVYDEISDDVWELRNNTSEKLKK